MGMYNELNNISRAVSGQTIQKKKDEQYKQYLSDLKIQLKDLLQLELFEGLKNNENIFDIDYKLHTVSKTLEGFKSTLKYVDIFKKYENDVRVYLLSSYYSIANQTRIIYQRTSKEATQSQQLKNDILKIKKQQEAEKLKKLQTQNRQQQQKAETIRKQEKSKKWIIFFKIIKYILIGIVATVGGLVWMTISLANGGKK